MDNRVCRANPAQIDLPQHDEIGKTRVTRLDLGGFADEFIVYFGYCTRGALIKHQPHFCKNVSQQ